MLQRAASNACSWWWASHIRTKQSKWLEQSMQDMEEKVQDMIKLIEEDGDSFAKRAEMYYKRRPELIGAVEETYRAFKALADRYDLLSKELQNANHTIATVFPEQVQFSMDDDDDDLPPSKTASKNNVHMPPANMANVPKVPKAPIENLKGFINTAPKPMKPKKPALSKSQTRNKIPVVKSGLSKDEALGQIDKLHKEILSLQTVKEFVKSSYESGLAKYWDIENQIMELQDRVSKLQDEFDVEMVIEDSEARTLMAEAALKSCQETLAALQEKQEKSTREAEEEFKKIESARQLLKSLRKEYMKDQSDVDEQKPSQEDEGDKSKGQANVVSNLIQESRGIDPLNFDPSTMESLTVTELAEKIDELVNKVISLETAVSSQTVLIDMLRTEADDLHAQIKNLEDEKETLIGDTQYLSTRVKEMEEKLNRIQDLNKNVESQNSNLQTDFAVARSSLGHLSEKLSNVEPDEEGDENDSLEDGPQPLHQNKEDRPQASSEPKLQGEIEDKKDVQTPLIVNDQKDVQTPVIVKDTKDVPRQETIKDQTRVQSQETTKDQIDVQSHETTKDQTDVQSHETIKDQKDVQSQEIKDQEVVKSDEKIKDTKDDEIQEIKDQKDVQSPNGKSSSASKTEDTKDVKEVAVHVAGSEPSVPKEEKTVQNSALILEKKPEELDPVDQSDKPDEDKRIAIIPATQDDINWQQILLTGTEDKEKILLKEYTEILRNYKEVKKKLSDAEKKEKDAQFESTLQMRELKEAILIRDQEIQQLRHKLSLPQESKDAKEESGAPSSSSGDQSVRPKSGSEDLQENEKDVSDPDKNKEDYIKMVFVDRSPTISVVEEKLRMEIDAILDENLDFWLRFSTSFHQVQKFKSEVGDLKDEISKLNEKKKQEGSGTAQPKADATAKMKSEARPIYKHLREIQTELTVWLEQSASLKDELKRRFASLCNIQEEITQALKEGVEEEEIKFSSHQAAKLQGEILNMKQENNKVKKELQAALDHVSSLQLEIETTLKHLNDEFGISSDHQPQLQHSMSKSRVPLRSFIFGTKQKKQKHSLFSFMHPNRKFHVVRAGMALTNSSHNSSSSS